MGRFRIAQIAGLARQMEFTPTDGRNRQILAAEELLLQIDPAKAYPYDFVLYRITGFHAKTAVKGFLSEDGFAGQLLTGLALQHDLGLLIESVSDTLNQRAGDLAQGVLTIEQIRQKFNVSAKTIQRWRRRGLAARRFIFAGGKKRVAFLAASVERFFSTRRDQLPQGLNFSAPDSSECGRVLKTARRLAAQGCTLDETLSRAGRKFNRSPITIRHILDQAGAPDFQHSVSDCERSFITDAYADRAPLTELALLLGRPRSAIYRVLVEDRFERLSRRRVRFIDDPLYHQPTAAQVIEQIASADVLAPVSIPAQDRLPRDLPPNLQSLCKAPLLNPSKERGLFLKFNFHKFQFVAARRKLDAAHVRWQDLESLESHWQQATQTKNQIVAANIRLVVSVARKHLPAGMAGVSNLMDLVSDGNLVLMRAVDGFDAHRGNRFSTYATLALMKDFARGHAASRSRASTLVEEVADSRASTSSQRLVERDQVNQLLSRLGEREQAIVRAHYGLTDGQEPATYEQVGRQLGISKQCARRIELTALAKLRAAANI